MLLVCPQKVITTLKFLSSSSKNSSYSTRSNNVSLTTPYRSQEIPLKQSNIIDDSMNPERKEEGVGEDGDEREISGIRVPRQKYIPVSKKDILDALLSMFHSPQETEDFRRFSSCLDSVLHAEHKCILEEMRTDFSLTHSPGEEVNVNGVQDNINGIGRVEEEDGAMPFKYNLDLSFLLSLSIKKAERSSSVDSRIAVATRFQHAFMKLLSNAEFEELSAQDLLLTSALNTDYLLTLPINVDWKRASKSNAIVFRRGYATEKQNGFLIAEKLDYIQSKLLQRIFFSLSKPLAKVGLCINEALKSTSQTKEIEYWIKRFKLWLEEPSFSQESYSHDEMILDNGELSESDLPIWVAAQKAVRRYQGFLSSVGPRERLIRKLLTWTGLVPSKPETPYELYRNDPTTSERHLRPIFLSRMSLGDIWRPASSECCGNDPWKMLKTAVSIFFSRSMLQEPAFQELILLYTEETVQRETQDSDEIPSLKLKIYERIPVPDLPVIFPHKKLSFRILDTVRLDVATILGLLAFFINYKFEDIRSSPSAVLLDVIAVGGLIIFVTRVALGYKQTWDRYQLLVNRTLYEKTVASGFGSVHFLLDASEQQQYKEVILSYGVLVQADKGQGTCRRSIGAICERFMYEKLKIKVEMPIDKAMDTLVRLGLVEEVFVDGNTQLKALPCSKACEALKRRWDSLFR
ncbi:hypothetical protein GIB67_038079 [Kingdonia uniflora]|uniref:Uncharacterized protein n=1 Tax=Kingdonia uniflora TaxID=39325 RepID=A0A7J7LZ54_9MAGN|nr:hypothetical protein GIB67_038079 [Kingdonia uniflora]